MSAHCRTDALGLDRHVWQTCVVPLFLVWGVQSAQAEDPPAMKDPLRAAYLNDARTYQFVGGDARPLVMEPQSVLHWASPDDWSGDIFVWTQSGRPEIIGSMLAGPASGEMRPFYHEFHALSINRLTRQTLPNGVVWDAPAPGIILKPVPGAPDVAAGEAARLRQMRSLIRDFSAHMMFNDSRWELRLLTQPIFRYRRPEGAATPADWIDGAVFVYVLTTGTDAEVALVLEARPVETDIQWQYAPVRITNRPAWMNHKGSEIWRVDRHDELAGTITRPYTTFYAGDKQISMSAENPPSATAPP
ncbi:MAG: hypothetical protein SFV23_00165 [Planctomycetaceae bacterium]|nr:hypothetical protein [Planctomycetaceae bacterium]